MNSKVKYSISVVMSVYNEQECIDDAIKYTMTALESDFEKYELIIIDDGSTDNTNKRILENIDKYHNIKLIINKTNLNIGKSLLNGFKEAKNEYVVFNSADLPLHPKDIKVLFEENMPFDLLNIERKVYVGSIWRKIVSICNRILTHILFPIVTIDIADMNYTIMFKNRILSRIKPKSTSPGCVLAEIIIKAKYLGMNVKVAVADFCPRLCGHAHFGKFKDIIWSLYDMLIFRISSYSLFFKRNK